MQKYTVLLLIVCIIVGSLFTNLRPIFSSDALDDINKQISDLTNALSMSKAATAPLESELTRLKKQIAGIRARVASIEDDIVEKKKNIDTGYQNMAKQANILNAAIRDMYIKSYYNSPFLALISAPSASEITQALAYQKAAADQDKMIITNIALSIIDLETKKQKLEDEQKRLSIAKANLDEQSAKLDTIVQGAKKYQQKLSTQIADLSVKQQQLLAQKQASLGLPTSAYTTQGGCSSDLTNGKDPGFSPKFAFFTYGVPHRVGMSQYGAKGRAEAGQDYHAILSAYFSNTQPSSADQNMNIHVKGTNEYGQSFDDNWSLEEYVKHIYEIPTGWHIQALKAQAVAARTYAVRIQTDKGYVLPSQSDQVVKRELNSDAWVQAVNQTAGEILSYNGQSIQAWFSSTAGGYTFSSGSVWGSDKPWTKNGTDASGPINSFSDLQNNAYDKASPWFYCDWGGRSQYAGTAWLKSEEVADIVNVILLLQSDPGLKEHLYQTDKPNPAGTDTWSADRLKQELQGRGITPFSSISDAGVSVDFGSGKVTSINFTGDAGSKSFAGDLFKTYFNIRAASNINIVGPLYNVEKK